MCYPKLKLGKKSKDHESFKQTRIVKTKWKKTGYQCLINQDVPLMISKSFANRGEKCPF